MVPAPVVDEVPAACPELGDLGSAPGCAVQRSVGDVLYTAEPNVPLHADASLSQPAGQLAGLAVEVEVVEVAEAVPGGVDRSLRVRGGELEGFVRASQLTPVAGDAWRDASERDVTWALSTSVSHRPLLTVAEGEQHQRLELRLSPALSGGAVRVDVQRWGDTEPLFVVEQCGPVSDDGPPCRRAHASFVDGKLVQLGGPDLQALAPQLLDDDPDCEAATPLPIDASPPELVLELATPPYRGTGPVAVRCERTGTTGALEVVTCTSAEEQRALFVVEEAYRWRRVVCGSDPLLELDAPLMYRGVQVIEDGQHRWEPAEDR